MAFHQWDVDLNLFALQDSNLRLAGSKPPRLRPYHLSQSLGVTFFVLGSRRMFFFIKCTFVG